MRREILMIRDTVANQYMPPTFVASIGVAMRSLSDELSPNGQAPDTMKKHARDYEIFHFGSFDDELGTFDLFERPISLGLLNVLVPQDALRAVN